MRLCLSDILTSDDNRTLASAIFSGVKMRELEEEFTEIAGPLAANNCGDSVRTNHDVEEETAAPGQLLIIRNVDRPIRPSGNCVNQ